MKNLVYEAVVDIMTEKFLKDEISLDIFTECVSRECDMQKEQDLEEDEEIIDEEDELDEGMFSSTFKILMAKDPKKAAMAAQAVGKKANLGTARKAAEVMKNTRYSM